MDKEIERLSKLSTIALQFNSPLKRASLDKQKPSLDQCIFLKEKMLGLGIPKSLNTNCGFYPFNLTFDFFCAPSQWLSITPQMCICSTDVVPRLSNSCVACLNFDIYITDPCALMLKIIINIPFMFTLWRKSIISIFFFFLLQLVPFVIY